jgi:hypothetical protein
MQKRILIWVVIIGAIMAAGNDAWAQSDFYVVGGSNPWKRSGTDIYYTAGSVGIGLVSPLYPLDVQGTGSAINATTSDTTGIAIYGTSSAYSGPGCAVYGISNSTDDAGASGVFGVIGGPGSGVKGFNDHFQGYGVFGENSAVGGVAIYGNNTAASGSGSGVKGTGVNNGVVGEATGKNGTERGVYGTSYQGYGVYGYTSLGIGVYGYSANSLSSIGVYGGSPNWGVYCDGNFRCTGNSLISGTKSAVVHTSKGDRKFYAQESPEVWFEDFGEGKLEGGKARIDLDPLFLETVTINDRSPLKVFIQLKDDCNGVYVRPQTKAFEVKELQNGNSSAAFTYRVVAKRKGFETARLDNAPDISKVAELKARNALAALK